MTQAEVIVRREGNDLSPSGLGPAYARCIEVGDAPPQARVLESERFDPGPLDPAHDPFTSTIESARTSTIVSIS